MGKKGKAQKAFDYDDDAAFDSLETELLGEGKSSFKALGNLDLDKKINLSVRVQNDIVRSEKKSEKRANSKGKEARATIEQVLDPRTRLILFKLMGVGFLTHIDGCLSTGKEANVYYAKGENGKEYAVKIFKTSILVFKDRDKYVSGEYRFRHGYCRSNPRKMVKVWAEKEMRNLKRLQMAGLPSPVPHVLKSHVLIMDFLGQNGWCAPRLKDAQLNFQQLHENYR
jgi:RIO kinase 1